MNPIKNLNYTWTGIVCSTVILTSCSIRKQEQPELNLPETYRHATGNTSDESIAALSYQDFFKDPMLLALIDKAIAQNNDLKVALKQIEIASLGYKQAKWSNVPKVDATFGTASITRPSDNSMNGLMANQFTGQKYTEDYTTSINLSWEADIWGKIKGVKEEALADFLQTQEAAKAVRTRLIAEVVTGYYNLLMLDKQVEITQANLAFSNHTLEILKKQQELGMITSLAVQQQEIMKEQIQKTIPSLEALINIQENALSLLTGEMPNLMERKISLDEVTIPDNLSTGIPSELLHYRPDVKSSELALRKSVASIHVAKMSMYPALNITAQGGLNAFKASNWFEIPGSLFGMAAGSLAQPILNGKQLKTKYKQAQLTSEQAALHFKQAVLIAVGEVSDALVQIEKLKEQQQIATTLVERAEEVVQQSVLLYQYSEATYLEVILAQSNKLQIELDQATIKMQRLSAITTLYRSLGGGSN